MQGTCGRCGRPLREGMNFCPGCGLPLGSAGPTVPSSGREGTLHFAAPGHPPYPMPAFYPPPMYMGSVTGRRAGAVGGAIVLLVAGILTFIGGLYYIFEAWWWWDFWLLIGVLCFIAFAFSVLALISVVRRTWRFLVPVACALLIASGILTLVDLWGLSFLILILSILGTVLLGVSWGQFRELPGAMAYGQYPMMAPMMVGAPPPMMAPMPSPQQGRVSLPGAPPAQAGAPPPPLWRREEDITVDLEE